MILIKKWILICASFFCLALNAQDVERLNVGILPVASTVAISSEQLKTINTKLKKAFVNKYRFTVFVGDSLTQRLNIDTITREIALADAKTKVSVYNPNKINFVVYVYVTGLRSSLVSIPNSSGGYDKGASAITNMKIKVLDLKSKKIVFDEALYHTEQYKYRTAEEAANLSINTFCELFKDLVNYSFPVELSIGEAETTNKKGLAETVTVKNAEFMYVHIKKGFLDVPSTKFEVSCLNDEGKMEVIGKLEAKQIDGTKVVAELDKGAKEIAKKIQEGKKLSLRIMDNTIEYYKNQGKK
jgi:hypothetical protein